MANCLALFIVIYDQAQPNNSMTFRYCEEIRRNTFVPVSIYLQIGMTSIITK